MPLVRAAQLHAPKELLKLVLCPSAQDMLCSQVVNKDVSMMEQQEGRVQGRTSSR